MEKICRPGDGHTPNPGLVAGNVFGRALGRHYFARAVFYRQPRIGFKGQAACGWWDTLCASLYRDDEELLGCGLKIFP